MRFFGSFNLLLFRNNWHNMSYCQKDETYGLLEIEDLRQSANLSHNLGHNNIQLVPRSKLRDYNHKQLFHCIANLKFPVPILRFLVILQFLMAGFL